MKVLFVCTGNTCRSLMAERLLLKLAADRGLPGVEARSAGVAAERYFPVPEGVRKALAERGTSPEGHVPQLVGRELLAWADLVVPMTRAHREGLLDQYPEFTSKTRLFSELAGRGEADVADPIGKPDAVYKACRDELESGLESFLRDHASQSRP
ncbi:MAG: low molecular weight protein arginine phosphatase [Elusimicrobia bacterium]|nr:low molecular weight protein arginine phosphatase [Elusimicrobiota bacterium]